jgi:hypothetical protein
VTTPGAWLALLAGVILFTGVVVSIRQPRPRMKTLALAATVISTVVVGWLAWYSSTTG